MLGKVKRHFWMMILVITTFAISNFILKAYADAAINNTAITVRWGYKGNIRPEQWGALDPRFILCIKGKEQSPINIPEKIEDAHARLILNYAASPLDEINDGTTEVQLNNQQLIINTGHSIQVNFPVNFQANETLMFAGNTYQLIQFHIHTPSENEWHDQAFPMEIHFVHQGNDGKLLVLAVFVKAGKNNAELDKIIKNLPSDKGKEHIIANEIINPMLLVPFIRKYYHFSGSLTTPPCAEGVQWLVMMVPIFASPAQIAELKKAMGGANARPIQALHERKIYFSD